MDFEETEEERTFRVEVRSWLDAHATRRIAGEQSDHSYMPGDGSPEADAAHVGACKEWQRVLYEGGWAGITWPVDAGGRGGPGWQQRIFNEERVRGATAFKVSSDKPVERIEKFDRTAEQIVMVPRVVGG